MTLRVTPTYYEDDGLRYDRVTEIIHQMWPIPGIQSWRETVGKARANRDLRHAERIGTTVDVAITKILSGQVETLKPQSVEVRQALRGFQEWHSLNPLHPRALQQPLLDQDYYIGGTPDCLAEEGYDWKTSSRFSFTQVLQIDRYWRMAEVHGYALSAYRLVRFDKILGTWEELILRPEGLQWQGQWITREFLDQTFQTLLRLYRAWHYVDGQEWSLPLPSDTTAPVGSPGLPNTGG